MFEQPEEEQQITWSAAPSSARLRHLLGLRTRDSRRAASRSAKEALEAQGVVAKPIFSTALDLCRQCCSESNTDSRPTGQWRQRARIHNGFDCPAPAVCRGRRKRNRQSLSTSAPSQSWSQSRSRRPRSLRRIRRVRKRVRLHQPHPQRPLLRKRSRRTVLRRLAPAASPASRSQPKKSRSRYLHPKARICIGASNPGRCVELQA